jgi:nicotinate-nucleotide adenylyltransferase
MGGTFDPIHYGHLFLAEEARVCCELQEVVFIPNGQPAHIEGKTTSAGTEERVLLTQLALEGNAAFSLSRIEVDRPGKSYAYDTLKLLQQELGSAADLHFIMGADSMNELLTWYRGEELFDLCRFIVATRPGHNLQRTHSFFTPAQWEKITLLAIPGLHIASRDLRQRVAKGYPIRYLTPDAVAETIEELGLYKERAEVQT